MDWVILRTKASNTLRLDRSLAAAGFDTWTPTEIQLRPGRKTSGKAEVIVAVMPTYVFARACHLLGLLDEAETSGSDHPDFSVFRHCERIPVIADHELNALRQIERKAAAKAKPVRFDLGSRVRTPDGPFQGLTGQVIEGARGEFTLVAFPGFNIPIKFASWTLDRAA